MGLLIICYTDLSISECGKKKKDIIVSVHIRQDSGKKKLQVNVKESKVGKVWPMAEKK